VLDFTKLSGNSKAGGVENVIVPTKYSFSSCSNIIFYLHLFFFCDSVDLMQLVEEAVDGCWVGHRARSGNTPDSGIGSVYSPPKQEDGVTVPTWKIPVETVIDIGFRAEVCPLGRTD